jgi:hypothetical protein
MAAPEAHYVGALPKKKKKSIMMDDDIQNPLDYEDSVVSNCLDQHLKKHNITISQPVDSWIESNTQIQGNIY